VAMAGPGEHENELLGVIRSEEFLD